MNKVIPDTPITLTNYNKGFVSFCMIVGAVASIKIGAYGVKKLIKALTPNK